MNRQSIACLLLASCIILSSCALSHLKKEGTKYHEAGLYELATQSFLNALIKKESDIDAKIGFMKSAALYAAELEQKIDKAYLDGNSESVVQYFSALKELTATGEKYQVPLEISERAFGEYTQAKNKYIEDYYSQALDALKKLDFNTANRLLSKVSGIDPKYKSTEQLLHFSTCEPIYKEALQHLKNNNYIEAYNSAHKLLAIDKDYKDVTSIQSECIAQIKHVSIYLNDNSNYIYRNFAKSLQNSTLNIINRSNNYPLSVISEDNYKAQTNEWYSSLANNIQMKTQEIIPAKSSIRVLVQNINFSSTKLKKEKKKGYLKTVNKNDSIIYRKIYYYEYSQSKDAKASISITISNRINKSIITSDVLNETESDYINYIYYNGRDEKNIIAGNWKESQTPFNPTYDEIYDSYLWRSKLKQKVSARKQLATNAQLESKVCNSLASSLALKIKNSL